MNLKKADGGTLELKVNEYLPKIKVNYTHVINSANNPISIDRGTQSDRYSCQFNFRGTEGYIDELLVAIQELRQEKKELELSGCEENFFGENVIHEGATIKCLVETMGKQTSPRFNVFNLPITLLASTASLTFQGTPVLPAGIKCLQHGWEGHSSWNNTLNETYYRRNYFVDHQKDSYFFNGQFILTNTETMNLLAFHKTVRGSAWAIDSANFGVAHMFGSEISGTEHDVVFTNLEYVKLSPTKNTVTLTLRRVG
jgi:hypothetical protein